MKRVLIITYYWPPNGGSGVQRWLKFAKYLPEYGWQPVVCTPENPLIAQRDESLMKDVAPDLEVLRLPIWDPVAKLQAKSGNPNVGLLQKEQGSTWKTKIITWLRGNLLIPDPKVFWVRPTVRYLQAYLQAHPVDVVVTTGPPHSVHLIGRGLQKRLGVKWVADFRDPWTRIYYFNSLMPSFLARSIHQKLEQSILNHADLVIAASEQIKIDFEAVSPQKVVKITNGFDGADFQTSHSEPEGFVLGHVGNFTATQHHEPFWEALAEMVRKDVTFAAHLKIRLVGNVDFVIVDAIRKNNLMDYLELIPYVSHNKVPEMLAGMRVLLLFINQTGDAKIILTGKLFEYLAAKREIFAIGPKGAELEQILNRSQAGTLIDFDEEKVVIKAQLEELFTAYQGGRSAEIPSKADQFSRKHLTEELSKALYELA